MIQTKTQNPITGLNFNEVYTKTMKEEQQKIIQPPRAEIPPMNEVLSHMNLIKAIIATYYDLDPNIVFYTKSRKSELVRARQMYCYIMMKNTRASLVQIGSGISSKHHATVLHSVKHISDLIETDKHTKADYQIIQQMYNERENTTFNTNKTRVVRMEKYSTVQSESGQVAAVITGANPEQINEICEILKIPKESITHHTKSPFYIY